MSEPLEHTECREAFGWVCWGMLIVFLAVARIARFIRGIYQ